MSAPTTSPVTGTAVHVSITVTVGGESESFAADAVPSDGGDPYRLARYTISAVRDEAIDYLMRHER